MNAPPHFKSLTMFSPREQQIIEALAAAKSMNAIAADLHLTPNTVKSYVKGIYHKAEVHSARELVVKMFHKVAPDSRREALERVLAAYDTAGLHAAVLALMRAWTGARRAIYWEIVSDGASAMTDRMREPTRLMDATAQVLDRGVVIVPRNAVRRDPLLAAGAGERKLEGEVLLTVLSIGDRRWLVALGEPPSGTFAEGAAKLVIGLVRLAEVQAELLRRKPTAMSSAAGMDSGKAVQQ